MLNQVLQWTGTACLLTMYILMNFYPNLYPWNIVAGLCGGLCYLAWSLRVANKPQVIVNLAGVLVCVGGLVKFFG